MKKFTGCWLLLLFMMIPGSLLASDQAVRQVGEPVIIAENSDFIFDHVVEGTVVSHEFVIENRGMAPLNILKVKTGCGCTTADYSKQINPGEKGKIVIRGNTNGYGGRRFSKTIRVITDVPDHGEIRLHISGNVDKFADISPSRVLLKKTAESRAQTVVRITPMDQYPFTITDIVVDSG